MDRTMKMSKATQRVITLITCFRAISGLNVSPTTSVRRARTVLNYRNEEQEEFLMHVSSMRNQPVTTTLVGQVLKDIYIVERHIPVASEKCELYEAFRVDDAMRENPMIVKLSDTLSDINAEYEVYTTVASQLCHEEQDLFVEIYDKIEQTHLTRGKSALIMEKGEDNLRFHLQRHGRFQGDELRVAMERVIRTVQALHNKGMIWTEIKAENFIIKQDESIKGIDLESVIYHNNFLQMYSAESVPPEFPIDDLNLRVPKIQPDYSFDIWGLGILLFEMATGKPFYDGGLMNLEFIKDKLRHKDEIEPFVDRKMWEVDPQARKIIKQCLAIDPSDRSSCQELLQDPYFQSIAETQQLANSEVPQSFVSTEAMTNIRQPVDAQEDSNSFGILVTTFPHLRNQMEGRQSGVLDLNLSDRLEAVLDAIHVCAQKNATVAKAFFELQPWKERYQDHAEEGSLLRHQLGLTVRLEAVLEAINTIAKSDPEVARDFLYILHQSPAPQAT